MIFIYKGESQSTEDQVQQLLSSYVLVSRDVIPIGPTQQEEHSIPGKKVDHQCGRFSSRIRF